MLDGRQCLVVDCGLWMLKKRTREKRGLAQGDGG